MLINRYKRQLKEAKQEIEETEQATRLEEKTMPELKELAKDKGIEGYSNMRKQELIEALEAGE